MWTDRETNGRTEGHDGTNSRFSQFCERAYKMEYQEKNTKGKARALDLCVTKIQEGFNRISREFSS
jgi:hypothetical protein